MTEPFPPTDDILDLSAERPFVAGSIQRVYAWPGRPDLLIKVIRPDFAAARWKGWRGWLKSRRRAGVLTAWQRTLTEHLVLRNGGEFAGRHIQDVVGFVETSEGIGMVTRAVRGRDGGYAPTLLSLIDQGRYTPQIAEKLDAWGRWLVDSPIAVGDLHAGNLVLGYDERHGERVVLIDGMGDKAAIPLNSLFPAVNRMQKRRRLKRMYGLIERRMARAARAGPAS